MTKGRRAQRTKGPAAPTAQPARVIRVHPCASVVKKRVAIQGFITTQPVFEQKTGKAGKGIGPTSFVALRVHSWFHRAERSKGGTTKHTKHSKIAGARASRRDLPRGRLRICDIRVICG